MRLMLRILALLPVLALSVSALADTVNFYLSGTLQDGGTATGLLSLDKSTGYFNPTRVTVLDHGSTYIFVGEFYEGPYLGTNPVEFYSTSYNQGNDNLLLSFPTLLVGYTGGPLCSTTNLCPGFTSSFTPYAGAADNFTVLTATQVPEPGSLALVLTGIATAVGAARRRIR